MGNWSPFVYIFFSIGVFLLVLGTTNAVFYIFSLFAFAVAVAYYYRNRKPSMQEIPSYYPADSQPINESSSPELSDPPPPPPEALEAPFESKNFVPELGNSKQDFEYMSKNEKANYMREYAEPAEKRMWEILIRV